MPPTVSTEGSTPVATTIWPDLCDRRAVDDHRPARRLRAAAIQALERTRAQALARAARRRASAGLGQDAGDDTAAGGLAGRVLARGLQPNPDLALRREVLVDTAKLRWRIERDYEELKSELGLAHFEGRGWQGFHYHATLCIATYGFLIRERAAFPPSGPRRLQGAVLSGRPRPRGAPDPTRASRRELDRHPAKATDRRPRQVALPMPMLPFVHAEAAPFSTLVTQ